MIEVVLRAVRVDVGSVTPLLLLEEVDGQRVLPIYIGSSEAASISYALQGLATPRPMTHDLLNDLVTALGAKIFSVEVITLVDSTYHAQIRLLQGSREILVSARPSDAIAVALRCKAPMLVSEEVMASEGRLMDLAPDSEVELLDDDIFDEQTENDLVDELRDFLETIRPEDFER
ncbi:MAG: bifunctional nuclease family protein [Actinomycetota bacterium]|jgi:bifunctional DNase/RNase